MKSGRTWKFGDNINTDLMLPGSLIYASEDEQKAAVFSSTRPGWVDQLIPGDVLIGGVNFGTGSSRPAARSLRNLGLGFLLADSINGLFFRNAVNFGFLALTCPNVSSAFEEGQFAEISIESMSARNCETGHVLPMMPVPSALLSLMLEGGIYPMLERRGLIGPPIAAL